MIRHQRLLLVRVLQIDSEAVLFKTISAPQSHMLTKSTVKYAYVCAVSKRKAINAQLPEHITCHLRLDSRLLPCADSFDSRDVGNFVEVLEACGVSQPAVLYTWVRT